MSEPADRALLIAELEGDLETLPKLLTTNSRSMERISAGAREELDSERILLLQKRLPGIPESWKRAIEDFIELLKSI